MVKMVRINVYISEEANKVIKQFQLDNNLSKKDEAIDQIIIKHKK